MKRTFRSFGFIIAAVFALSLASCTFLTNLLGGGSPENHAPKAMISASRSTAWETQAIEFDSSGSSDPDEGDSLSYSWNFGDGSALATEASLSHSFATAGTYTVRLVVADKKGVKGEDSLSIAITAAAASKAVFTADFVTEVNKTATFDASASTDQNDGGSIVSYAWVFGDGASAAGATATHAYAAEGSYVVSLTVTNSAGKTAVYEKTVYVMQAEVNDAPTVSAGSSRLIKALVGESVSFTGKASDPDTGDSLTITWDFGDSGTASTATAAHSYAVGGIYSATLTAKDAAGLSDADTLVVDVNTIPVAAFAVSDSEVGRGVEVSFDSSASYDGDQDELSYAWDFGDGGSSTVANPAHSYAAAGSFTVRLTISDPEGESSTATAIVSVANLLPSVEIADFESSADSNKAIGSTFYCTAQPADADLESLKIEWLVDSVVKKTTSSASAPYAASSFSFVASTAKTYTVLCRVTDGLGAVATDSVAVVAADLYTNDSEDPLAILAAMSSDADALLALAESGAASRALTAPKIYVLVGKAVPFDLTRSFDQGGLQLGLDAAAALSADWDFGDGTTLDSAALLQSHKFLTAGTYSVLATIYDDDLKGDFDTVTVPIQALNPPNKAPSAKAGGVYTGTILDGTTSIAVRLSGAASSDPDGTISSYAWTWSDGAAAQTGSSIARSFTAPGVYVATLTVKDSATPPKSAADKACVVINKEIVNHAPIANIASECNMIKGEALVVNSSLCVDPDGDTMSYAWSLADSASTLR